MLKIIIIIIGYTPHNFITHITILQQMMEIYIYNFKINKRIHFLKINKFFSLSTMNLTLGHGSCKIVINNAKKFQVVIFFTTSSWWKLTMFSLKSSGNLRESSSKKFCRSNPRNSFVTCQHLSNKCCDFFFQHLTIYTFQAPFPTFPIVICWFHFQCSVRSTCNVVQIEGVEQARYVNTSQAKLVLLWKGSLGHSLLVMISVNQHLCWYLQEGRMSAQECVLIAESTKVLLASFFPQLPNPRCGCSSPDTSWCCPGTIFFVLL